MGIVWKLLGAATALVAALVAYVIYLGWDVQRWDARIDALCAANGGRDVATRVYETAVAPETPEYFSETKPVRSLHIAERREGRSLGEKYPFVFETRVVEVLNGSDPSVVKYSERIIRVSDGKVLGERFGYQRGGGGIPVPDLSTNHKCPVDSNSTRLEVNVFINHPLHKERATK